MKPSGVEGLFVGWRGRTVRLKWHRGRRRGSDTVFTAARIAEGLALGASVEVDLNRHGEGGFAVLHDATLDRETTGTGPVAGHGPAELRWLRLRANAGAPDGHPLLLLDDLPGILGEIHPQAVLQLDLKTPGTELTEADCAAFAAALAGLERNVILSSCDPLAVRRLAARCPGLRVGHDPCRDKARIEALRTTLDIDAFVQASLAEASRTGSTVETIYLRASLICETAERGGNLVAAFQARGLSVDAWTIAEANAQSAPQVKTLLNLGVDQITTDDPIGLERLIASL